MKAKRAVLGVGAAAAAVLAGGILWTMLHPRESSVRELTDSLSYADGEITFQIPGDLAHPENLTLHAAGRAEYDGGFSASLHFLEEENENWVPGQVYSIPYDPAYTALTLDIAYTGQEETIDLLDYVK